LPASGIANSSLIFAAGKKRFVIGNPLQMTGKFGYAA
jgi:hypothetical protein